MKKLILAFGIILAGVFSVHAQENKADKETNKMVTTLTNVCQLTPDQVAKVQPMISTFVQTKIANKQKYVNDADGLRTANKENRENLKSQLNTVLTTDQQEKYKGYMKEQKEKKQESKGE